MKIVLINLDKDVDRLAAATKQLKSLNMQFDRLPAVYAKEMSQEELKKCVNSFRWWCAIGRPWCVGEIGCALSHFKAWERCADAICVLEDDVIIESDFRSVLENVERWVDPTRPQVVLLSNHSREHGDGICRSTGDMFAEGYVITKAAAVALHSANYPLQVPCDWWTRWVSRGVIELYHAFPTVCSQDKIQYESGTRASGCFDARNLSPVAYVWHKFKRLVGKSLDQLLPIR